MKKMIVIAALIGGMLMPAQIMAQKNDRNSKPKIENRDSRRGYNKKDNKGGKKNMNYGKPGKGKKPGKGMGMNKPGRPKQRPIIVNRPAPRPIIINRPAPRPCPPPPPPAPCNYYYRNEVAEAAAAVVGLAALVALIAD